MIDQLKNTFATFNSEDIAYLNGYVLCDLGDAILKYEMIQDPGPGCLPGTQQNSALLLEWAQDVSDLSQDEADMLIEEIWKDDTIRAKMGSPGKPTRIIRTT